MYLFVLLCLVPFSKGFEVPETKYTLLFDSPIYAFGEESAEMVDTSRVIVERINESVAVMYGEIEFKKGLGPNTMIEIKVNKEASGGKYETMFTHDICDFCKEMGDIESDYKTYLQYFGIEECPVEPGAYEIKNFAMNSDDMDLNSQNVGRYEVHLVVFEKTGDNCQTDRKPMFTLKIDTIVEPLD